MHSDHGWRSRRGHGRPNRRRSYVWEWIVISGTVLIVAGMLATTLMTRYYDDRIAPNVTIHGLQVGELRMAEARALLEDQLRPFRQAPVTFVYGNRVWAPTAEELGIDVTVETALSDAHAIGRQPNVLAGLNETRAVWRDGRVIALDVRFNEARLHAYMQEIASKIDQEPVDASIQLENGRVIVQAEQQGYQVIVDELLQQTKQSAATLTPQRLDIPVATRTPALRERAIAPVRQQLERLLAQPVTITVGEARRTFSSTDLAALVTLRVIHEADSPMITPTLDLAPFSVWLNEIAPSMMRDPVEPTVRFRDERMQIVVPGQNGQRLIIPQALTLIRAELWRGERQLQIPLTPILPHIRPETLADLGIVELVAQGKSDFSGSADYRIQNIQAGAAQMDGVLIPPGATFSFNQQVGSIDESNGFTQGYAIISGRTQLEWGGGVCQVSTTVFRAAFWAGAPIVERNQHSFRIRWYEVYEPIGMDAAIFTGPNGYDLQFINDTGQYLLMQTDVNLPRRSLTINLYGTKPDREVEQTPPAITNQRPPPNEPRYVADPELPPGTIKQTDTKRGGMDVHIGRIVRQNGQIIRSDTFRSRYQPWPDIFALGPGATPPPPTSVPTDPAPLQEEISLPTLTPDPAPSQEESAPPTPTPIP